MKAINDEKRGPRIGPFTRLMLAGLAIPFLLTGCGKPPLPARPAAPPAARDAEFRREVIEVVPGVRVALGYGLANSILIEGDDGLIIVDTMESVAAARAAWQALRPAPHPEDAKQQKPVKAIIYTHYHSDHVNGASVFAGDDRPEIISHESTRVQLDRLISATGPAIYQRSMRQFGVLLPPDADHDDGIGPRLVYDQDREVGLLRPTRTFSGDHLALTIAGVALELWHAPGETEDQIFIWLPQRKLLLCGDNFYRAFPNLYAIRGTAYRDPRLWVASLDHMRSFPIEHLVPSHTRPIDGAAEIALRLTHYRDAIQFVHDQTVRHMNLGLSPDQIVGKVKLPAHLAQDPWLREAYGMVEWSVRSVFAGYLGWYSGQARDLFPDPPERRAAQVVDLAGGAAAALQRARQAAGAGELQWALTLADDVLQVDPQSRAARALKSDVLVKMAERQTSANARNYLLTQAHEARGDLTIPPIARSKIPASVVRDTPLGSLFESMAVNLDPDKSAAVDRVVRFRFSEGAQVFTVHVRQGVAEVRAGEDGATPDITVTTTETAWKDVVFERRNLARVLLSGDLTVQGPAGATASLLSFLSLFRAG